MNKEQFQNTMKKLKDGDKFSKLNKKEQKEELKKQQKIQQEYARRKKEAAKQLIEGMEQLKRKD